jgi:uncharacterized protein
MADFAEQLEAKYQRLLQILSEIERPAIALSGGVDSALLAYTAFQATGERALAITADSPAMPRREMRQASQLVQQIGIRHIFIHSHEVEHPAYRANPVERCYICKKEIFSQLNQVARQMGCTVICHGENVDDLVDHRPGSLAAQELGARAPLREAGLGKQEIRCLARRFDLPVWDQPAMACLSSRVPAGSEITVEKLAQIEAAEDFLLDLGFRQVRVRHHDTLARIELGQDEMQNILAHTQAIIERFQELGFRYITLDLAGYRLSGLEQIREGKP